MGEVLRLAGEEGSLPSRGAPVGWGPGERSPNAGSAKELEGAVIVATLELHEVQILIQTQRHCPHCLHHPTPCHTHLISANCESINTFSQHLLPLLCSQLVLLFMLPPSQDLPTHIQPQPFPSRLHTRDQTIAPPLRTFPVVPPSAVQILSRTQALPMAFKPSKR